MDEYVANSKKEKEIVKRIRKKHKRWKVGRWFVLALALWVGYSAVSMVARAGPGLNSEEYGLAIIGVSLLPFIAMLIAYAISIGGGRDILLARTSEKVYIDSTQLRDVFTPNFKQVINADTVEICVPYANIREMHWNADLCRLEIAAEYKYVLLNNNSTIEQNVSNKPVILYSYFGSMEKMMNQIEEYSNKKITGRN